MASKLLADGYFNPQRKQLATDQLHELQSLVDSANKRVREIEEAIDTETETYSRKLVQSGLGRPLAPGQKATKEAPDHDSLSVINAGKGPFAVSFSKHSVPEIAVYMDERDDFVKTTCASLQQFFKTH